MPDFINIYNLSFSYPSLSQALFESVTLRIHKGWTAITGSNGSGKTSFIKLVGGLLTPSSGTITGPASFYYCEQKTEDIPDGLVKFLESRDSSAFKIKASLGIKDEWAERWNTLSQGERKKCQIATALFLDPDVLAVDEPSNHLDYESKQFLFNALKSYRGIGLLVSHDRELLDGLCTNTLFIDDHKIDIRRGNYSSASAERDRENKSRADRYDSLNKEIKKLEVHTAESKQKADKVDKEMSKRKIPRKDRDAKGKIDLARLTGRDAVAGRLYKKSKNELDRKTELLNSIDVNRKYSTGIEFNAAKMNRYYPLVLTSVQIQLEAEKNLYVPDLMISAGDRIGITGNNGAGKTTFINHVVNNAGFREEDLIYIPQEINNSEISKLVKRVKSMKNKDKGKIMTIISRLNSNPEHLLETDEPSPGEVRKLLLAEGISLDPAIIIMDEPTNHMDLPSIESIEDALKGCACPVLLVSHDKIFLQNVVTTYWNFVEDPKGYHVEIQ